MRTPSLLSPWVAAAVLSIAVTACAPSPRSRDPYSSTAPATQAATPPAIPVVYANEHGTPFKDLPAREVARIVARAREMTPPTKKIWFVLIRAGTWFPAGVVYFMPEKTEGRLRTGECQTIWTKDSEKMLSRYNERERYVQVVPPDAAREDSPRVPDIKWLPFHRIDPGVEDKQIVPLVDKMQQVRPPEDEVFLEHDQPVSAISLEGDQFRVEVAWPDKGYEHYFMFKATAKGFELVEENTVFH